MYGNTVYIIYAHTYVCTHVHTYVCMYAHMFAYVCTQMTEIDRPIQLSMGDLSSHNYCLGRGQGCHSPAYGSTIHIHHTQYIHTHPHTPPHTYTHPHTHTHTHTHTYIILYTHTVGVKGESIKASPCGSKGTDNLKVPNSREFSRIQESHIKGMLKGDRLHLWTHTGNRWPIHHCLQDEPLSPWTAKVS